MIFVYLQSSIHHFTGLVGTDIMTTPSWLVSSIGRVKHWYCRGHGFKSCTGLNFFQAWFSLLLNYSPESLWKQNTKIYWRRVGRDCNTIAIFLWAVTGGLGEVGVVMFSGAAAYNFSRDSPLTALFYCWNCSSIHPSVEFWQLMYFIALTSLTVMIGVVRYM